METVAQPSVFAAPSYNPALAVFSKLLALSVLGLILAGAFVTSHDAGLSVPDWPTSYGYNMFLFPIELWRGGIFFEHLHRLIASGVGLLTLIFAVWVTFVEPRRWVKALAAIALIAVIVQGVLGGLTVLYLLPAAISVAHGLLAQTFFCLTIFLAYIQSREWFAVERSGELVVTPQLRWSLFLVGVLFVQLLLGALMRHTESGLAVPDFPAMGGSFFPWITDQMLTNVNQLRHALIKDPVTSGQVLIHLLHRGGSLVVSGVLIITAVKVLRRPSIGRGTHSLAWILVLLLVLQFALGVLTVITVRSPEITSFHVMIGAALLGTTALLALRNCRTN